jgi:hypothetical protein
MRENFIFLMFVAFVLIWGREDAAMELKILRDRGNNSNVDVSGFLPSRSTRIEKIAIIGLESNKG